MAAMLTYIMLVSLEVGLGKFGVAVFAEIISGVDVSTGRTISGDVGENIAIGKVDAVNVGDGVGFGSNHFSNSGEPISATVIVTIPVTTATHSGTKAARSAPCFFSSLVLVLPVVS